MTVWQGAGMHKTGPWSGDLPISLQWKTLIRDPLETGKFPEETTFVVFAMFSCWFHHLSWSLPLCCPSGYFRITQVHDDRRTCRMTWQYFLFVFCGNPRQRLESVTSYISSVGLWQTSDADSISGSVLSLISCCQQTRYDTFLFFSRGDEMIWPCLQSFQNINWPPPCSSPFFSLHLFRVQYLVGVSDSGLQRQSNDMASVPITGLLPHYWNPFM